MSKSMAPSAFCKAATATLLALAAAVPATAQQIDKQSPAITAAPVIPQLMRFTGLAPNRGGDTVEVVIRIYSSRQGGEPLWSETQHAVIGTDGKFTVLLGAASQGGLPDFIFRSGEGRWIGVSIERGPEQSRSLLASVAYAMKAADAESLAGRKAADFVTQDQLTARLAAPPVVTSPAIVAQPNTSPSGAGTANTIPLWIDSATLGTSAITQGGTATSPRIGINRAAPSSTLDVSGGTTLRGNVVIPNHTSATTAGAVDSPQFRLESSSYQAGSGPVTQSFVWQAMGLGNNTSTPTSSLNLLYAPGAATPAATGLSIAPNGQITFAANQLFPGTGTLTGLTAGKGLQGGGTAGTVSLNIDPAVVPQLNAPNTFNGAQTIVGNQLIEGNESVAGTATFDGNPPGGGEVTAINLNTTAGSGLLSQGVTGVTANGTNVGIAATGSANNSVAVNASAGALNGVGVLTYGTAEGVTATSNSGYSIAVAGTAQGAGSSGLYGSGAGQGVFAVGPTAVWGSGSNYGAILKATGITGVGIAVSAPHIALSATGTAYGVSATAAGIGVYGVATGSWSYAVEGQNSVATGVGVVARHGSTFSKTAGSFEDGASTALYVDSNLNDPDKGYYALLATSDNIIAGVFSNNSAVAPALLVQNVGGDAIVTNTAGATGNPRQPGSIVPLIQAAGRNGQCIITADGDSLCTGTHKSAVAIEGGARQVEVYGVQSAENWFEDAGSAQLIDGKAVVNLDPTFAATVNADVEYHVFLTPRGDCEGLYVGTETASGFEVHELHRGTSTLRFDYRILARRRGTEGVRLTDVTQPMETLSARPRANFEKADHPEAIQPRPVLEAPALPAEPPSPRLPANLAHR